MKTSVGIIGLGNMGGGMAQALLREFAVIGYDIDNDRQDALNDWGGTPVDSPCEVGEQTEIVLLSLPSDNALRSALRGDDGLLEGLESGDLIVDTSTVSPTASWEMREACADVGVAYLDAPVSGGKRNADTGELITMVGGPTDTFERASPILECVAETVNHVGSAGAGVVVKIINNYIFGVNQLVMSEALMMARAAGIKDEQFVKVVSQSSGASYAVDRNMRRFVIPGEYEAEASLSILHKDVELAEDFAQEFDVPLLVGGGVRNIYRYADQLGLAESDVSAVIRLYELEDALQTT